MKSKMIEIEFKPKPYFYGAKIEIDVFFERNAQITYKLKTFKRYRICDGPTKMTFIFTEEARQKKTIDF